MGFFSKTCAKTHLPVCAAPFKGDDFFCDVVALLPDGKKIVGAYDGYGNVGGHSLFDNYADDHFDLVKFVLAHAYNGETYADLGESGREMGQGFFMSQRFLDYCKKKKSFKDYAEYAKAFDKYADWN